jgi:BlaI family penicillinase repressor
MSSLMARPASATLTEVELQILQVLWDLGPSPVRLIHERLGASRGTNYSTTVKMLGVMREKGLVRRDELARPHLYRPTLTRERAGKRMLRDLVEKIYEGSSLSLVLQALSTNKASPEEIDQIRRLLDQMEGEQK